MKKTFIFLFAILLCMTGGIAVASSFDVASAEVEYDEVEVSNGQQLLSTLSALSTYDNDSIKIVLTGDIDLEGIDLSSLYLERRTFTGFFEGNGYEISNFTLSSSTNVYGLIPYASGATIQNVRITGQVEFNFAENNTLPVYAGVLVGQGENVTIKNCELYNITSLSAIEEAQEERIEHSISLPVYSNLTFGGLIGIATGYSSSLQANRSVIENCINYYDLNLNMLTSSRVSAGGIVGLLNNGSKVINCLNFGNISLQGQSVSTADSQYLGGIAGEISGNATTIKNTASDGTISLSSNGQNCFAGAIVGYLNCPQASTNYNVNFSYWSQGVIQFYGTGYGITSNYLAQQAVINQALLSTSSLFDTVEYGFNFNYDFTMLEGEILLQRFQEYDFEFHTTLDNGNIISLASFSSANYGTSSRLSERYGEEITITITFAEDYVGYYSLSAISPILVNSNELPADDYVSQPLTSSRGVYGYEIKVTACDLTAGTYSFTLDSNQYNCEFEISESAYAENQGLLRRVGATRPTTIIRFPFSYRDRSVSVRAEGNGYFVFSHWELFYKDSNGEFTLQGVMSDSISENAVVSVEYGTAPFDREFRLVANFTDEDAVKLTIGNYSQGSVSSITVDDAIYEGGQLLVPSSGTITLVVVTNSGYLMDVEAFTTFIQNLYGEGNSTDGLVSEPITDEATGQTTYRFRINMSNLYSNLTDKQLPITLIINEDDSVNNDDLLWVYITVPIVAVLIIGIVIFIILRHRGGGGGGKKVKAVKESVKKTNYKDYYI